MAVVAAALTIFQEGPYDQEIKSLLLYQLRTSPGDLPLRRRSFGNALSRSRSLPRVGVEPTTNGLTVRRSTVEAERTRLEPATPGGIGWSGNSGTWVRIPPSPPNGRPPGREGYEPSKGWFI